MEDHNIILDRADTTNNLSGEMVIVSSPVNGQLHCTFLSAFTGSISVEFSSGVAKLEHTGARALATGGCAPPVQVLLKIIGAECIFINRELGVKSTQMC